MLIDPNLRDPHPALMLALLMLAASVVMSYLLRRRDAEPGIYRADLAWLRAALYFCFCITAAHYSGVLWAVVGSEPVTQAQLASPGWWAVSLMGLIIILIGYGLIWPRGTFHDDRRRRPVISTIFGLVWGCCQGLWFLSIWAWLERSGLPILAVPFLAYLLIGAYNALWHRFYWDIHVSPPHNYREWNGRKVLMAHTPNLIFCMAYLYVFGNLLVFVLLQALALALSARAMRFPSWADDYRAEAGAERSRRSSPSASAQAVAAAAQV